VSQAALAFAPNTGTGMVRAAGIVANDTAMVVDLEAGIRTRKSSAGTSPGSRNDGQEERALSALPMLREANVGIFAPLGHDKRFPSGGSRLSLSSRFLGGRWLWNVGRAVQAERARELFRLQHELFEEKLVKAASATGLPARIALEVVRRSTATPFSFADEANGGIVGARAGRDSVRAD